MKEKPLEQILEEFKQNINRQKEDTGKYQSVISRYYQRLAKPASSAVRFIKNKATDAGALVKELYEEGTLGSIAKWSLPIAGAAVLAGTFGFKDYIINTFNAYVTAAGIGGAMGTTLPSSLGLVNEFDSGNKKPFSSYALRSCVYGVIGSTAGIIIQTVLATITDDFRNASLRYPAIQEEPVMSGLFGGAIALMIGMLSALYTQNELKKQKNDE